MPSCRVWSAPIKIRSVTADIDSDNGLRCNRAMDSKAGDGFLIIVIIISYVPLRV